MEGQKGELKIKNTPKFLVQNKVFPYVLMVFVIIKILTLLVTPNENKGFASDLTIDNILNAVNRERSLRNLSTLNPNDKLSLAAQSKSDDMQARHFFAHVDPDGHYIWDKIVAAGYSPYLQLGENLAIEFYDTDSLVSAWMNSPTHRANILQESFRDQGMGINMGDVAIGQYHSAITNTFGTLATQNKSTIQPTTQTVPKTVTKIVIKPKPKTLSAETPTTTPVIAQELPNTLPTTSPIKTRGDFPVLAVIEESFALPNQSPDTSTSTTSTPPKSLEISQPQNAVIGNSNSTKIVDSEINRYLILICGIALLLLMLSNIRESVEKKFGSLDKKINNMVVLLISIIVIAFMYWL